jgi:hypothetical protein
MFMALADKTKGEWDQRKFPLNWGLLLFLVLVLDVKLAIKIPVLIIACCLQPGFRWGFRFRDSRLPLFYPLMIGIVLIDWLLFKGFKDTDYNIVALTGILFWICCIVAVHQVRLFIDGSETETVHRTLLVFFILNLLVSSVDMIRIIWETKALNPYLYQGMYQKYFIRTGDYVKGLSFDTSTTNAMINAFGVVYFLKRKKGWMLLCCMACLLATGSNFTNLLLLGTFIYLFLFDSDKEQKGGILLCVLMGAVFLGKVSPQNNHYTEETLKGFLRKSQAAAQGATAGQRTAGQVQVAAGQSATRQGTPGQSAIGQGASGQSASVDSTDAKRMAHAQFYMDSIRLVIWLKAKADSAAGKTPVTASVQWTPKPSIPAPNINEGPYLRRDNDTSAEQRILYAFIDSHRGELPMAGHPSVSLAGRVATLGEGSAHTSGKGMAFKQVFSWLRNHPSKILTGDGAGNFSSKLAFRSAGLGIMGDYPARYAYISSDFLRNHLDIYLDFFSRPKQMHSLTNSPDSVYGQLLGEYGVLGVGSLGLFYIGYFARRLRRRSYGFPLLVLLAGSFFIAYWFEQLSVVILFELLLFTEAKAEAQAAAEAEMVAKAIAKTPVSE